MESYDSDFRVILQVLQRDNNIADAYAVRRACHELARLVTWKRDLRLDMVAAGVLQTLVTVVETHVEPNPDVVVDCCRFLRRCISLKDTGLLRLVVEHAVQDTSGEDEVAHACETIYALVYENQNNAVSAVEECEILRSLEELLARYPSSKRVVQETSRILFQLLTLLPEVRDEIVVAQFIERILDFLETNRDNCDIQLLWHTVKLLELLTRSHEGAKDELCRCRGPVVIIHAINSLFFSTRKAPQTLVCLQFVGCLLLNQIALNSDEPPGAAPNWPVSKRRVDHLVHSGAPQFALQILKTLGAECTHVAEQVVRLLELVATIEANRIPLTRLGASRQVKVVYNSTAHDGLRALCERAVAAIEGT